MNVSLNEMIPLLSVGGRKEREDEVRDEDDWKGYDPPSRGATSANERTSEVSRSAITGFINSSPLLSAGEALQNGVNCYTRTAAVSKRVRKSLQDFYCKEKNSILFLGNRNLGMMEVANVNDLESLCGKYLMLGRPGIGKSIFCQKIAYQWAAEGLWKDRFLYLFLVPLRNLTEARYPSGEQNLENILAKECFLPQSREEYLHLMEDIREVLRNDSHRVLMILDGYNETTHMPKAIYRQLFAPSGLLFPHMIVTSRPYGTAAIQKQMEIDCAFEYRGFTNIGIEKYISQYFESVMPKKEFVEDKAARLIYFLRKHRDFATTAREPLLLEMICLLWDEQGEKIEDLTMPELYKAAVEQLFAQYLFNQKSRIPCQKNLLDEKKKLSCALGKIACEMVKAGQLFVDGNLIRESAKDFNMSTQEI
ncbi:MAG: NACHT domain-containing protein, partial [Waddliaceae bacterium]